LSDIALSTGKSIPTINKYFDQLASAQDEVKKPLPGHKKISLIADATYFGNEYGFLCFADGKRIIYCMEIESENKLIFARSLRKIKQAGYNISCVVIDGRIGIENAIHQILPRIPIQMCHFHMKRIIQRIIGSGLLKSGHVIANNLSDLMAKITLINGQDFIDEFFQIKAKHYLLMAQFSDYHHAEKCFAAIESIERYLPHLFSYQESPRENIPNTTNFLEGIFSHVKEKINIHRGLKIQRKKNAVKFILLNTPKYPK